MGHWSSVLWMNLATEKRTSLITIDLIHQEDVAKSDLFRLVQFLQNFYEKCFLRENAKHLHRKISWNQVLHFLLIVNWFHGNLVIFRLWNRKKQWVKKNSWNWLTFLKNTSISRNFTIFTKSWTQIDRTQDAGSSVLFRIIEFVLASLLSDPLLSFYAL